MESIERAANTPDPGLAVLKRLAETTGGRMFQVTSKMTLQKIYDEIAQDLRGQYLLGYVPPATTKGNRFHRLSLKTKDGKLQVLARDYFYAP